MMQIEDDYFCIECMKSVPTVQIGEPPDWESQTINICSECLKKAIKLLDHGASNERRVEKHT